MHAPPGRAHARSGGDLAGFEALENDLVSLGNSHTSLVSAAVAE